MWVCVLGLFLFGQCKKLRILRQEAVLGCDNLRILSDVWFSMVLLLFDAVLECVKT